MTGHGETSIRTATAADLEALGRLGAILVRVHHDFDAQRFIPPAGAIAEGYGWFLGTQLDRDDACVLVAERDGTVIAYVYAAVEPHDWNELRDRAGFVHDLVVDPTARGAGLGKALLEAAMDWLRAQGMPRVVLWTAQGNPGAERLFAAEGFRRTMIEMTREL